MEESNFDLLIIDDETENIEILNEYLEEYHYSFNIVSATNADEALKFLDGKKFHVIILDIKMPEKDGFYILDQLKNHRINHSSQVIVQSASVYQESKNKSYDMGAVFYLTKPFSMNALFDVLDVVIRQLR